MLRFHSLQVAEIRPDADDAVAISLSGAQELAQPYRGLAGQHIVLRTRIDGREVRRTYSLVSAPGEWPLRIVVRVHAHGTMSRYLAEHLRIGDAIDVLPPNGSLTPRFVSGGRRTFVAFAAGCGITPILSIVRAVLAGDTGSRLLLFYGNTGANRAMCLEELLALKDRYPDRLALHFIMSREPQEAELYNGRIDAARVQRLAQAFFDPAAVAEYFVCGPGTMIDEVSALLRTLGVEAERLHGEHFNLEGAPESPAQGVPVSAGSAAAADQAEVTVVMDGRRRSFTMRMNDESVLDAAARAGLELPFSCRAGVCSTCRTRVVTGKVVMQENHALEDWELEAGYVLACQSRVTTPVLELDYDEK
jgi:ring-1,2-phenylacetyl-CoA epoxidase subunit PaaE